jgi:hypothetical protein
MQAAHHRFFRILSATVMATLFLCQVVGSLCPMVPAVVMAETVIQDADAGHQMGMGSKCLDSLPTSPKSFGTPDMHQLTPLESLHSALCIQLPVFHTQAADVHSSDSGPPLYTRLLTFRI